MKSKKVHKHIMDISAEYKKEYERMQKEGPFKGMENKEVFIMAMIVGFKEGKHKPITKKLKGGFFRTAYLSDEEKALISAIAIANKKDLEILNKEKQHIIYSIAEEYANGGFSILKNMLALPGTFEKRLGLDLRKKLKELKKIDF